MTLIVGVDSLSSLEDANTYFQNRLHNEVWFTTSSEKREVSLKWVAQLFNREYWLGTVTDPNQALAWPRRGIYDREGRYIDDATTPQDVLAASYEYALDLIPNDLTAETSASGKIERIKAGSVEVEYSIPTSVLVMPSRVKSMLSHYLVGGGSQYVKVLWRV